MRQFILNSLCAGIVLCCVSAADSNRDCCPPGTVRITDSLFIDATEVANIHWQEFLWWTEHKYGRESDEFKAILPDTTVWAAIDTAYVRHYHRHPKYHYFPVVGITRKQAMSFCAWRTERVRELQARLKGRAGRKAQKYRYRLPTRAEWETAAAAGFSEKTLRKLARKRYAGLAHYNLIRVKSPPETDTAGAHRSDIMTPVFAYWPNHFGLYNIIGNVAEIIDEAGIAKGGGWRHRENEVAVESDFAYDGPQSWLGFRCVSEVKGPVR